MVEPSSQLYLPTVEPCSPESFYPEPVEPSDYLEPTCPRMEVLNHSFIDKVALAIDWSGRSHLCVDTKYREWVLFGEEFTKLIYMNPLMVIIPNCQSGLFMSRLCLWLGKAKDRLSVDQPD